MPAIVIYCIDKILFFFNYFFQQLFETDSKVSIIFVHALGLIMFNPCCILQAIVTCQRWQI